MTPKHQRFHLDHRSSSDQRRLRPVSTTSSLPTCAPCVRLAIRTVFNGQLRCGKAAPARRLAVYRVSDAPGVRPLQSDYCTRDPRFRRLSTSPAKVTAQARTALIMNSCDSGSRSGVSRMFAKLYVQTEYMPSGKTPPQ